MMSGITLPFWAGWRVIAVNPFDSAAIGALQISLCLAAAALLLRLSIAALATRSLIEKMPRADAETCLPENTTSPAVRIVLAPPGSGVVAAVGLFRPVLAIDPTVLRHLSPDEARAVFEHEYAHIRRRDALRIGAMSAGAAMVSVTLALSLAAYSSFLVRDFEMHIWLAVAIGLAAIATTIGLNHWCDRRLSDMCELACDDIARSKVGGEALASALLKLAPRVARRHGGGFALNLLSGISLRTGVRRALNGGKPMPVVRRLAFGVFAATALFTCAHAASAVERLRIGIVEPDCYACCLVAREMRRGRL